MSYRSPLAQLSWVLALLPQLFTDCVHAAKRTGSGPRLRRKANPGRSEPPICHGSQKQRIRQGGARASLKVTFPSRQRPYRVECTGSLPNSEVKRRRARSVPGWGTAREALRVLLAFFRARSLQGWLFSTPNCVFTKFQGGTVAILAQGTLSGRCVRRRTFWRSVLDIVAYACFLSDFQFFQG